MATVNGITAEKAQEILDGTIETAAIVGTSLILTRHDSSTFSAGNFQTYIDSQIGTAIDTAIDTEVLPAVTGSVTDLGANVSGAISLTSLTPDQLVNRLVKATLVGNVSLAASALPANPRPGTQFAIVFKQDAVGGRTLTLTNIKRSQGVLALSTAPNAVDIIVFMTDGTTWYAGAMGLAFA